MRSVAVVPCCRIGFGADLSLGPAINIRCRAMCRPKAMNFLSAFKVQFCEFSTFDVIDDGHGVPAHDVDLFLSYCYDDCYDETSSVFRQQSHSFMTRRHRFLMTAVKSIIGPSLGVFKVNNWAKFV